MSQENAAPTPSAPLPLQWKVHASRLLNEVLSNSTTITLKVPLNIFGKLLGAVGERAAELNDPQLNELMCRLTIYTVADPDSPDYDPGAVDSVSRLAQAARANDTAQEAAKRCLRQAGSALDACKMAVSEQLMAAINGSDRTARTEDGFIRWGLVEKRVHTLIEGYWQNARLSNGEPQISK